MLMYQEISSTLLKNEAIPIKLENRASLIPLVYPRVPRGLILSFKAFRADTRRNREAKCLENIPFNVKSNSLSMCVVI